VVLGGTRGIGRAIAQALAAEAATVVLSGRDGVRADGVAEDIRRDGGSAESVAIDLTDLEGTRATLDGIVARLGHLDVLVANAGVNPWFTRAEELTAEAWDEGFAVNLRGTFFAIQAAGRHMLRQGSGTIVSVSSATVAVGTPRGLPYTATKGGLDAMTRGLAVEWADRGVRVNGIAPGYVETDLTEGLRNHDSLARSILDKVPLRRFATVEEIAGLVVYLASDEASYVIGQTYYVDGGMAVA
jgi:3-oxoacyl-[acyl-carrier protein] reductase